MQAYQSPPCPYCGATWNQPGAQSCANCRNPLPPPPPAYAPPGYQNYPPQSYPQPSQYPGQPGSGYPGYAPPGYMQPGYAEQPTGYGQDPGHTPAERAAPGTTLRLFGQTFTIPVALPPAVGRYLPRIATGAVGVAALLVLFVGILP